MSNGIDLGELLRKHTEENLGRSLDFARMSSMSDRSFTQFSKSLKKSFWSSTTALVAALKQCTDEDRSFMVTEWKHNDDEK